MPELPDIVLYVDRLEDFIGGRTLQKLRVLNAFVLRSVDPPPAALEGRTVTGISRLGKRIVIAFQGDVFLVIHLMVAGRLRWRPPGKKIGGKLALAALEFEHGTLYLTEAGTTRRAMIFVLAGEQGLAAFDRGGLDVFDADVATFSERLRSANHTLKRALTDPRLFDGIGNAYSDEILHRARLSPLQLTRNLDDAEVATLYHACRDTLQEWMQRLAEDVGDGFPEEVTAFRPEMAVHGRFRQPCPVCGSPVQRIRYASNETNYCARCQTGGRLLADRAMSRLLKDDWPRSLDELD